MPSIRGSMLLPSKAASSGSLISSASSTVGRISKEMIGVSIVWPPLYLFGQLTMKGVRMPPSSRLPLKPFKGALSASMFLAPPLSVRNISRVLLNNPSFFSLPITSPMPSSRCLSIAIKIARLWDRPGNFC